MSEPLCCSGSCGRPHSLNGNFCCCEDGRGAKWLQIGQGLFSTQRQNAHPIISFMCVAGSYTLSLGAGAEENPFKLYHAQAEEPSVLSSVQANR